MEQSHDLGHPQRPMVEQQLGEHVALSPTPQPDAPHWFHAFIIVRGCDNEAAASATRPREARNLLSSKPVPPGGTFGVHRSGG